MCSSSRSTPSRPDAIVILTCGPQRIVIDLAQGARAVSWTVDGHELLTGAGDAPVESGMYPMAPWAGRLRDNRLSWDGIDTELPATYAGWAIHGTCLSQPVTVVEHHEDAAASLLVTRMTDHPSWPWPMTVDITWRLTEEVLTTTIDVHAERDAFPAVLGWHPWFRRELGVGGPLEWAIDATQQLVRGPDHLPTGERVPYSPDSGPFDDAFVVPDGRARLAWPGAMTIEVASSGGWYVVYDERPTAVCLEPQSGPPDGLDGHHGVASPGSPVSLTVDWRVVR